MDREAFFLSLGTGLRSGQRFCVHTPPAPEVPCRGVVIQAPAFAEELNHTRRMAALQARAFARAGYAVLQMDLFGTGDSAADFGDATWEAWVEDIGAACDWMRVRYDAPLCLWGVRAGCLLAAAVAKGRAIDRLLFWQPVTSGAQWLTQFLRLRVAGEMLAGEAKGVMAEMRGSLANGRAVEISGYRLSSSLAGRVERVELALPDRPVRVRWIDVATRPDGNPSPLAARYIEQWTQAGHRAHHRVVQGAAFWQLPGADECPALLAVSVSALDAMGVP